MCSDTVVSSKLTEEYSRESARVSLLTARQFGNMRENDFFLGVGRLEGGEGGISAHSEHRFRHLEEGSRKPVLGVWDKCARKRVILCACFM